MDMDTLGFFLGSLVAVLAFSILLSLLVSLLSFYLSVSAYSVCTFTWDWVFWIAIFYPFEQVAEITVAKRKVAPLLLHTVQESVFGVFFRAVYDGVCKGTYAVFWTIPFCSLVFPLMFLEALFNADWGFLRAVEAAYDAVKSDVVLRAYVRIETAEAADNNGSHRRSTSCPLAREALRSRSSPPSARLPDGSIYDRRRERYG